MRALAAATLAALALPAAAFAHANLVKREPSFGQRVETAPRQIVLHFDQGVIVVPQSVQVKTQRGVPMTAGPTRTAKNGKLVSVPVRRLPTGAYTVRWQVTSLEGHVLSGVYTFGVRRNPPPPTEAFGASGPTGTEDVVRWGLFLALALLVGGLGFRLIVVGDRATPQLDRRFYLVAAAGVIGALELGIAGFILRASDALQLPFGRLLYGDLSPLAQGTRFGLAFIVMTLGFGLVAALVFLSWLTERAALLWPAFALSLGLCSGLSLSGHSAVDTGASWRSELADWVHLSAACLWIGGLVQLGLVVWPLAPELRREAFLRFSRLAAVLVALLVGAGAYLAYLRLPEASDLWEEPYGRVLAIKLVLAALALGWGGLHRLVVRPMLERGEPPAGLSRSLLGEGAVGMAVLLVAAVLVNANPPRRPAPGGSATVGAAR
ncbi:MAG TPA: copper resistance protein CopC [Gaiellaceae bacterium]|nr:copper resistance protein CopC [Gaiellaceae bacterium]